MSADGERLDCLNCGAALYGPYCHRCGQHDRDLDVPFHRLMIEAIGNAIGFDGRFWRTVRPLLTRPGFLTRQYLSGRREHYVSPFRLYIFVSMLFLVVLALTGSSVVVENDAEATGPVKAGFRITATPQGTKIEKRTEEESAPAEDPAAAEAEGGGGTGSEPDAEDGDGLPPWLEAMLEKFETEVIDDKRSFDRAFREYLGHVLLLLVPLFALFLHLLYRGRERRYQHHLIFSVHVHSAAFLALCIALPLDRLLGYTADGPVKSLANVAVMVYLFLALRRVYRESRWRTLAKEVTLVWAHAFAVTMTLLTLVVVIVLLS